MLILHGAVDSNMRVGAGLFPVCLRDDLHGVRSTIEAYSRSATLSRRSEASACGYDLRKGGALGVQLRVLSRGAWSSYRIDRWD